MSPYAAAAASAYVQQKAATAKDPKQAPLPIVGSIEDLVKKYRGTPEELRVGIQLAVMAAAATAAALSMIPLESNFGSHLAGRILGDLVSPGVNKAINAPISDYLDNIFPTAELNVRMLVTGIEKGALSDTEVIDTAVDAGLKDKEIKKMLKIAKVARFDKETDHDYDIIKRYEDAIIAAELAAARYDVDQAIADRNAEIKAITKQLEQEAMEAAAV